MVFFDLNVYKKSSFSKRASEPSAFHTVLLP